MDKIDPNLEALLMDIHSGSQELLINLNKILQNYSVVEINASLIKRIRLAFPTFSSIQNYLNDLEDVLRLDDDSKLHSFLSSYSTNYDQMIEKLYSNLRPYLQRQIKIITLSNSHTVFEIIRKINKEFQVEEVIVCESRPQLEGVILSEHLANENISVSLIIEADIPNYIEKADICLIGADIILSNGNIVNKTGSKLLALICRFYNIPIYVITDSSKRSKENTFNQKLGPPSQIISRKKERIKVRNYYFEEIDNNLIVKIITENGILYG